MDKGFLLNVIDVVENDLFDGRHGELAFQPRERHLWAETILPSADAKKYAIGNVYKKWRADKICKKLYFEWKNNK